MKIVLAAINAKYIHANLAVCSLRAFSDEYKEQIQIKEYTIYWQIFTRRKRIWSLFPVIYGIWEWWRN